MKHGTPYVHLDIDRDPMLRTGGLSFQQAFDCVCWNIVEDGHGEKDRNTREVDLH
jgi:hypothetical protein